MGIPFPLTWTQWSTWNTCPYWYKRQYLDKDVPRQESPALEKGKRLHDEIEQFLLGNAERLPEEVHPSWVDDFLALREAVADGDAMVSVTLRIDGVAYGRIDAFVKDAAQRIIDFEIGKARPYALEMREQLQFYGWLAGRKCTGELWWVEHPSWMAHLELETRAPDVLDRVWRKRVEAVHTEPYEQTPNWKCRYCQVRDCLYNTNKEEA